MSDDETKEVVQKKRSTRGKRGKGQKDKPKESLSPPLESLTSLCSKLLHITPPEEKQSSSGFNENEKPSPYTTGDNVPSESRKGSKKKKKVKPAINEKDADPYHQIWKEVLGETKKQEQTRIRKQKQNKESEKKKKGTKQDKSIKINNKEKIEKTLLRKAEKKKKKDSSFEKYIKKCEILKILEQQNPEKPIYYKGYLRINSRNFKHAYLNIDEEQDVLISGISNRNRAMDRDLVVIRINPEEEWSPCLTGDVQKTGTVVCILEKIHPRKAIGTLTKGTNNWTFKPRDFRVPFLKINPKSVPTEVNSSPETYNNTLFLANMDLWLEPYRCMGSIEEIVGDIDDLEVETAAILFENGLDITPIDKKLMKNLPGTNYKLTTDDLSDREDWRHACVFTIDPATAVDLDDAMSCEKLPNGNYEVGVHIADVTHFLKAFTPLDNIVSERATTVYLVNTVYHMLPKSLCELCSLLPGKDRLTFSVIWEMTPEARVIKHRFAKSVINSCYQMAYEEAQAMIEEPSREWTKTDLSGLRGNFTPNNLCERVNFLYKLSTQMRERRFADGALSINQPKLQMILDPETRLPVSYRIEERQDSNRLIEEFMLLANMTVAKHLHDTMSDTALLRIHGEPLKRVIAHTAESLALFGVHLNTEHAGSLQSSLSLYEKTGVETYDQEFATNCRMMVINALCVQSMPRANYVCSASIKKEEGLRHFALNVPFYTHFTSPIRRYADIVVHRLLCASITNSPLPSAWTANLCAQIASNCNGKKYSAKIAQEKSNELYFMDLLSRKGPTETMAIVMKVKHGTMDVILCHVGIIATVHYSDVQKEATFEYNEKHSVATVIVKWKKTGTRQTINVFSIINVLIKKLPHRFAIHSVLLPPPIDDTPISV